jgi:hypothetical protein
MFFEYNTENFSICGNFDCHMLDVACTFLLNDYKFAVLLHV